jgi:hypothetical protein
MVVIVRDGDLMAEDVWEWCRGRVPTFAVPRFVRFRDTLPPTPSEKIQRNVSVRRRPPWRGSPTGRSSRSATEGSPPARKGRRARPQSSRIPRQAVVPPSTGMTAPVMNDASSLASQHTSLATSCTSPMRGIR